MREMLKILGKSVREYKKPALLTPLLVTLEVVMEVVIPLLMANLIDKGIYAGQMNEILKIGVMLVVASLLSLVLSAGYFPLWATTKALICGTSASASSSLISIREPAMRS